MKYVIRTFYKFFPVESPIILKKLLEEESSGLELVGSVLIAHEGLNATLAGKDNQIQIFFEKLMTISGLQNIDFKVSHAVKLPFARLKFKIKKEIVTIGDDNVNPNEVVGTYVEPNDWNAILESEEYVVIDTRNDYEVGLGTFKNAINPKIKSFKEFPLWWADNKNKYKSKKVAMFCTGGIRCEKSTSYVLQNGFNDVVHLRGGVLKYLEMISKSDSMWRGDCFVFDQRVSVSHGLQEGPQSICHACRRPVGIDDMQHKLYEEGISCKSCFHQHNESRRERFRERQKQISLAKRHGYKHIGR